MLHGFMNLLSSHVTNSCAYILLHLFYRILYLCVCSPSFLSSTSSVAVIEVSLDDLPPFDYRRSMII